MGEESIEEVPHGVVNVLAMSWFPEKSCLTLVCGAVCFSGSFSRNFLKESQTPCTTCGSGLCAGWIALHMLV